MATWADIFVPLATHFVGRFWYSLCRYTHLFVAYCVIVHEVNCSWALPRNVALSVIHICTVGIFPFVSSYLSFIIYHLSFIIYHLSSSTFCHTPPSRRFSSPFDRYCRRCHLFIFVTLRLLLLSVERPQNPPSRARTLDLKSPHCRALPKASQPARPEALCNLKDRLIPLSSNLRPFWMRRLVQSSFTALSALWRNA